MTYGEWELSVTLHKLLLALSRSGVEISAKEDPESSDLHRTIDEARRVVARWRLPCPGPCLSQ